MINSVFSICKNPVLMLFRVHYPGLTLIPEPFFKSREEFIGTFLLIIGE